MHMSDWSSAVCSSDLRYLTKIKHKETRTLASCCSESRMILPLPRKTSQTAQVARLTRLRNTNLTPPELCRLLVTLALPETIRQLPMKRLAKPIYEIGRAHVCTPVTNTPRECRLLMDTKQQ